MHKAKGLEWDRVYLMSVNSYDFPSALPGDSFIAERWYIRDGLNLEAEALALLEAVTGATGVEDEGRTMKDENRAMTLPCRGTRLLCHPWATRPKGATGYAAERLRLLYVAITRAKRDLIVTWNTGRCPAKRSPRPHR